MANTNGGIHNWVFSRGGPVRRALGEGHMPKQGVDGQTAAKALIKAFFDGGHQIGNIHARKLDAAVRLFCQETVEVEQLDGTQPPVVGEVNQIDTGGVLTEQIPSFPFQAYWKPPETAEMPALGRPDQIANLARIGNSFPAPPTGARFGDLSL